MKIVPNEENGWHFPSEKPTIGTPVLIEYDADGDSYELEVGNYGEMEIDPEKHYLVVNKNSLYWSCNADKIIEESRIVGWHYLTEEQNDPDEIIEDDEDFEVEKI